MAKLGSNIYELTMTQEPYMTTICLTVKVSSINLPLLTIFITRKSDKTDTVNNPRQYGITQIRF